MSSSSSSSSSSSVVVETGNIQKSSEVSTIQLVIDVPADVCISNKVCIYI
jgi:hypothetical protein